MTRLIDADAIKYRRQVCYKKDDSDEIWVEWLATASEIDKEPTVDAEPIKHGHWIEGPMCIECSCCGETFSDEIVYMCDPYRKPKRCPECGAHMDEEEQDG